MNSLSLVGQPISTDMQAYFRFPPELGPFTSVPVFAAPRSGRVWFAQSEEYRLYQRTISGDTVRIAETAHRAPRLTAAEAPLIERLLSENSLSRSDFPLEKQVIRLIHMLPDGHFLVQVETETPEFGRELFGHEFDVFDPDGVFLGTVTTPFEVDGQVAPAVRGDTAVFVTRDDLDVSYAVRAIIRRPVR